MYFNVKYFTRFFLPIIVFLSSCSDRITFNREIRNCAKTNKPALLSVYHWQQNFYYIFKKANLDSILTTTDTIYAIISYNRGIMDFGISIFAKEWEYHLWFRHYHKSLKKDFGTNFSNDPLLLFLMKRKDLNCFSETDKYFVLKSSKNSILLLCTKNSKGKLKREIICN